VCASHAELPGIPDSGRSRTSRWSSFVADARAETPRILHQLGNPAHRLRVGHNEKSLLIHLSDEDGDGWTMFAVDRATRRYAVAQAPRQVDAAEHACEALYRAD
jgi:hypothetical protein